MNAEHESHQRLMMGCRIQGQRMDNSTERVIYNEMGKDQAIPNNIAELWVRNHKISGTASHRSAAL